MSDRFDYVIVGAGSAGCVMAARLAEAGHTVCVLEAGRNDRHPYIHIPSGYIKNVFEPGATSTWGFVSEPVPGTDRRVDLHQGRVVGGSSSINGMVYNRGQAADYDGWAAMGNTGWSYQEVLPGQLPLRRARAAGPLPRRDLRRLSQTAAQPRQRDGGVARPRGAAHHWS